MLFLQPTTPLLLLSLMKSQADIPQDLTDDDKAFIFQFLDAELNSRVLYVLLYGGLQRLEPCHVGIDR